MQTRRNAVKADNKSNINDHDNHHKNSPWKGNIIFQ